MRACRFINTPVTVAVSPSLVCLFLIDTLQINRTWYNNNTNSNNDRQQWHFLLFPHTITSCLNNFSFQYFLINNEFKTTAILSHASLVVIDTIYTHHGVALVCLIVQNRPSISDVYHQNRVKNTSLLNDFRQMPVSNPPLVLSCVDGHVDICRQSCRQLSTNRQAYSH